MRKIKFRGKRVDNSKWIYGYYLPWHAVTDLVGNEPYAQIFEEYKKDGKYIAKGWAKVLFNSVSEYTGLTDKNGKEIYEGDILKIFISIIPNNKPFYGFVGYDKSSFCLFDKYGIRRAKFDTINKEEMEVIGNIFDNPELLEDKA